MKFKHVYPVMAVMAYVALIYLMYAHDSWLGIASYVMGFILCEFTIYYYADNDATVLAEIASIFWFIIPVAVVLAALFFFVVLTPIQWVASRVKDSE